MLSTILQNFLDFFTTLNGIFYVITYLLGGIPFGYLLAKYIGGVDIKKSGSCNIGATNVLRVLKTKDPKLAKKLGALTLLLDILKGAIVILIAKYIGMDANTLWSIAVISIIGHCYSPFLNFEGGKGIATGFGVLLVLITIPTLIALGFWFVVAKLLKISSFASLIALISIIIATKIIYPDGLPIIDTFIPLYLVIFIVFYKHIPNIIRLYKKEEGKVV